MPPIGTYVFFDLETTGLPSEEYNKTKITELSMVAARRDHILDTRAGCKPRVLHKLTRCFNPGKRISDPSSDITGLDNFLLEHESFFDTTNFEIINSFLSTLTQPVCLIAHNGLKFDFPILKRQLDMLKVSFSGDIMCADSLDAFRQILEAKKSENAVVQATKLDEVDLSANNCLSMQAVNETTPKQVKPELKRPYHAVNSRQRLPFSAPKRPKEYTDKYNLPDVYARVMGRPAIDAHRAESDCMMLLEIAVALSKEFVSWVEADGNHQHFSAVCAMTPGVKIGS